MVLWLEHHKMFKLSRELQYPPKSPSLSSLHHLLQTALSFATQFKFHNKAPACRRKLYSVLLRVCVPVQKKKKIITLPLYHHACLKLLMVALLLADFPMEDFHKSSHSHE